jgi:hypothetical protein
VIEVDRVAIGRELPSIGGSQRAIKSRRSVPTAGSYGSVGRDNSAERITPRWPRLPEFIR